MTRTHQIVYWIATVWLCLGMLSTGLVQVFKLQADTAFITNLGYPDYFLTMLGAWKLLGVIALLLPRMPLLKEWAYAGFFFTTTGALISHIAHHDPFNEMGPSLLLMVLTALSWYFRPADRKVVSLMP